MGRDLCFKVDGKMFAVTPLDVAPVLLSFKCSPENFAELCERPNIIPAPYMARAQWVALQSLSAIPDYELRDLLAESYRLVFERLPKRRQEELTSAAGTKFTSKPKAASSKKKAAKKPAKAAKSKTKAGRNKKTAKKAARRRK